MSRDKGNSEREYAALIVEICDRAQMDCWANGFGPSFMIQSSFRYWMRQLKRARRVHRLTKQTKQREKWWTDKIGTTGERRRTPLTRLRLATIKRAPKEWALKL